MWELELICSGAGLGLSFVVAVMSSVYSRLPVALVILCV